MTDMFYLFMVESEPVKFYPYTSLVSKRIVDIPYTAAKDIYHGVMGNMLDKFKTAGIECHTDNKIVFEVKSHGHTMFLGFYDGAISLGFGVRGDHVPKP